MLKTTLIKAAKESGKLMKEYSTKQFTIDSKDSLNNLVTEVDHASEKLIIGIIREQFPDHYILGLNRSRGLFYVIPRNMGKSGNVGSLGHGDDQRIGLPGRVIIFQEAAP